MLLPFVVQVHVVHAYDQESSIVQPAWMTWALSFRLHGDPAPIPVRDVHLTTPLKIMIERMCMSLSEVAPPLDPRYRVPCPSTSTSAAQPSLSDAPCPPQMVERLV